MAGTINDFIAQRYAGEAGGESLGCANLQPFFTIKKGDILLDLGCGNGEQAAKLCRLVGETGLVYGLDLTREMLEQAAKKNAHANLVFIQGDMHHLPLKAAAVNAVFSNCVINHSPDKQTVFAEIYRVLKKDGHFLISDVMAVEKLPAEISSDPQNIAACWGGAIPKDEYLAIIKNAGFSHIYELSARQYYKNNFLLESIILKGVKT